MAVEALLYILFIVVQQPQNDLSKVVLEVAKVLDSGPTNVTFLQVVKVSAEAKFIAFVQVENNGELDSLAKTLWQIGNVVIEVKPVINGNAFAQQLGVPENLTTSEIRLQNESLFYEEIVVDQDDKSTEEILDLLRQQIELQFTLRSRGELSIVLYKEFESTKIHTLVNIPDVPEYDLQLNFFPLRLEPGSTVDVNVKAVQFVSEYIATNP